MNTAFGDSDIDPLLQTGAEVDNQRWSDGDAPQLLPTDCPTMPRMYEAILREDWTAAELDAIHQSPEAQALRERVNRHVWYPTKLQLFKYSRGLLEGDDLQDVRHHLEVDKCKRSLRLHRWMTVDRHAASMFDRRLQSVSEATGIDRITDMLFGTRQTLRTIPALGDFTPETQLSHQAQFDTDGWTVGLAKKHASDCLTLESHTLGEAALLRISVTDDAGIPVESRYVVLRQGAEAAVATLVLKTSVPSNSTVYCLVVQSSDLTDIDANWLRDDFAAAQRDDPSGIEAWKKWATATEESATLGEHMRAAVDDILSP